MDTMPLILRKRMRTIIVNVIRGGSYEKKFNTKICHITAKVGITLYGNSMNFRGYTELQWRYQETALSAVSRGFGTPIPPGTASPVNR